MIVVCENNGFAVTTRMEQTTPIKCLSDRAAAYAIPGVTIDGTDPLASYEAIAAAVARAHAGDGPSLVEAIVRRWQGHAAWDRGPYLTDEERELIRKMDPLPRFRARLIEEHVLTAEEIATIDAEMQATMQEALRFAEESPAPPSTKEEAARFAFMTASERS